MAHPWYHDVMAPRSFGGAPNDYLALEAWLDYTKSHIADCRHRLFLHNTWGIFVAERILGVTLCRASDGKILPTRPILETHVIQNFGRIPTLARCLTQLPSTSLEGSLSLLEQCQQSSTTMGGTWQDYQPLHQFLDWPHEHVLDSRHRAFYTMAGEVTLLAEAFGEEYTRPSDKMVISTRTVAEAHILAEMELIPTLEECLEGLHLEHWMCARVVPASVTKHAWRELQERRR